MGHRITIIALILATVLDRGCSRPQANYDLMDVQRGVGGHEVWMEGVPRAKANEQVDDMRPVIVDHEESYGLLGTEDQWKMHGTEGKKIQAAVNAAAEADNGGSGGNSSGGGSSGGDDNYGDPQPIQPGAIRPGVDDEDAGADTGGSGSGGSNSGSGYSSYGGGGGNYGDSSDDLMDPNEGGAPEDPLRALMPRVLVQTRKTQPAQPQVQLAPVANDPELYIGADGGIYRMAKSMANAPTSSTTTRKAKKTGSQPWTLWRLLICALVAGLVVAIVMALYLVHQRYRKRETLVVHVSPTNAHDGQPVVTVTPVQEGDETSSTS